MLFNFKCKVDVSVVFSSGYDVSTSYPRSVMYIYIDMILNDAIARSDGIVPKVFKPSRFEWDYISATWDKICFL